MTVVGIDFIDRFFRENDRFVTVVFSVFQRKCCGCLFMTAADREKPANPGPSLKKGSSEGAFARIETGGFHG